MMVTVTLDEITLNAIKAALDGWTKHLEAEIARYQGRVARDYPKANEHDQRALVWNNDAWMQAKRAREIVGDLQVTDHPADATWATA